MTTPLTPATGAPAATNSGPEGDGETISDWLARQHDFDAGLFGAPEGDDAGDAGDDPLTGPDGQPWDPQRAMTTLEAVRNDFKRERELRQAAEERTAAILAAAGYEVIDDDTPQTPEEVAAALRQAQAGTRQAQVQLNVIQRAATTGADPARLLGWAPFIQAVSGLDPRAGDFAAQVDAAVTAQLTANPWLRAEGGNAATPPAAAPGTKQSVSATVTPGVSGGQISGGGVPAPITEADLARMTPAEIAKAYHAGQLGHLTG
jgi:hypothetical protein